MEDKQKAVVGMEAKKHRFLLNSSSSSWAAIPFPTGTIATWGRTSESWVPGSTTHIRLEGIKISKSHCSICLLAGSDELRVKDSSSNGIFINGVRHKGVEVPLAVFAEFLVVSLVEEISVRGDSKHLEERTT